MLSVSQWHSNILLEDITLSSSQPDCPLFTLQRYRATNYEVGVDVAHDSSCKDELFSLIIDESAD